MKAKYILPALPALMMMAACSDDDNDGFKVYDDEVQTLTVGDFRDDHDFLLGAIFSFQGELRRGELQTVAQTSSTTNYNLPLFQMISGANDDDFYNDLVEQMVASGIDFVMPNCRGILPKGEENKVQSNKYYRDHGDPTRIADFIAALKRRGEENLKIAIFDDAPASWSAAMNMNENGSYSRHNPADYPIYDTDRIYPYIWDYNIMRAFDNFYNENSDNNKYLLRYQGMPVLMIWSINGFVTGDNAGYVKAILDRLHADFKARFGEDLFIIADKDFLNRDSEITSDDVEALHNWFTAAANSTATNFNHTLYSYNGHNVGVTVPGFSVGDISGAWQFIDANHGKTLTSAFDTFISGGADLVVCESFDDMAENAAYWRCEDQTYYDFPNQRINILRKNNSNFEVAYPADLRVEAEGCDFYSDLTSGNSGGEYRKGDLDVMRCNDGWAGWCVTDAEAGEWLKWSELPFRSGTTDIVIRYASNGSAAVRVDAGGNMGETVSLPSTGGSWSDATIATVDFDFYRWREVILNIESGSIDINYIRLIHQ